MAPLIQFRNEVIINELLIFWSLARQLSYLSISKFLYETNAPIS